MCNKRLKIVADKAIPFLEGVFDPYADMTYLPGDKIGPEDVRDADVLMVRTRTKCNADLLEGSKVKFIATATIGTDHIDFPYCDSKGIVVRNAPGCNAGGVMEYVFSALYGLASRKSISLQGDTIGIIGVGHVGSLIERMGRALGFKILKCDPPRAEAEGSFGFCDLEYLLQNSQIVTLHVPLDETTRGMANSEFFSLMQPGAFFINAARGEVVCDDALKAAIPKLGPVIIDTWNHEPDIDLDLMDKVAIATPHIAGYSYQGKQNGTAAAVRAVAHYFGITELYEFFPKTDLPENEAVKLDLKDLNQGEIASVLQYNYPIFTDDFMLRLNPENFDKLRSEYNYRREVYID
ncbi:MAG: 4-phosphoerythronate dehydrogenase [Bacteroidales bacterium]|jgi:D-isomer specific 2-hydroxyacid dehydrogenase NAD-binding|nr:4-phosphoerythronate dehydrogenase [Bacteroidales bacterium]